MCKDTNNAVWIYSSAYEKPRCSACGVATNDTISRLVDLSVTAGEAHARLEVNAPPYCSHCGAKMSGARRMGEENGKYD